MKKVLVLFIITTIFTALLPAVPTATASAITYYVNHDFNSAPGGKQITVTNISATPTTHSRYEILGASYPWRSVEYTGLTPSFAYVENGDGVAMPQAYNNTSGFIKAAGKNQYPNLSMEMKNPVTLETEQTTGESGILYIDMRIKRAGTGSPVDLWFYDVDGKVISTLYLPNSGTIQAPRMNATKPENGTATTTTIANAQTTNWWYYRMIINFNTATLKAYIGETLDTLEPFNSAVTSFPFYNTAAKDFYKVSMGVANQGKSGVSFDDFMVYSMPKTGIELSPIQFTNGKGGKITSIAGESVVNASAALENWDEAPAEAIMVLGAYKDNTLIDLTSKGPENPIKKNTQGIIGASINISELGDIDYVKAFILKDIKNIRPLAGGVATLYNRTDKYLFGTLQNTDERLAANYNAGMRMALLELAWSSFYPSDGAKNTTYINSKKLQLEKYRSEGYKVMLDFGIQYPPSWVYGYANSRWKNQYGDVYNSGNPGETGVNAVFNRAIREKQEAYVNAVFDELGNDFDIVRLGWMRYGEIGYPDSIYSTKTNCYWAFDDIAQGKTGGLADGVEVCPVPGWTPGTPSANNQDARLFVDWYMNSIKNYHDWQITTVRKFYNNDLAMLYPSWGVRPGHIDTAVAGNLDGTSGPESGNRDIQRGFDFARMINGITDERVIVYGTWIDSNPSWSGVDNPCPIEFLSDLAKAHPLNLKIMGENTGGGGMAEMELTFSRMKENGLIGVMWAFESDLYNGQKPELADYSALIYQYNADILQVD